MLLLCSKPTSYPTSEAFRQQQQSFLTRLPKQTKGWNGRLTDQLSDGNSAGHPSLHYKAGLEPMFSRTCSITGFERSRAQ